MKTTRFLRFMMLLVLLFLGFKGRTVSGQTVVWNRQAFGQTMNDPCGIPFNWPDNNNWSQEEVISNACNQNYTSQPSNWSTPTYPDGPNVDVILGAPAPTNLDRQVTLHSLTVMAGAGNLNMAAGSSFNVEIYDFQTDGVFTRLGGGGINPFIRVAGTLTKSGGPGILDLADEGDSLFFDIEGGVVQVNSGTLQIGRGECTGATFNVAANAALVLANGSSFVHWAGNYSGTGAGTVQFNDGMIGVLAPGATLNFPGDLFQWGGGVLGAANPTNNVGTINLVGSGGKQIDSIFFTNSGTMIQSGTGNLGFGTNAYMTNAANGIYDIRSDAGFAPGGRIDNLGIFKKSGGTGESIIGDETTSFNLLGGTVQVDTGTLKLFRGDCTGGNFIVAAGAAVDLTSGSFFTNYKGTYSGTGSGAVQLNSGILHSIDPGATLNLTGDLFQWSGGTIAASAPFNNAGTINLVGPNGKGIDGQGFVNSGIMTHSGTGDLGFGPNAYMTNAVSGIYDIRSDVGIANGRFDNRGIFKKSGGTGVSSTFGNGDPNAAYFNQLGGTVEVETGTLKLGRGDSTGGTFVVAAGAAIDLTSGSTFVNYNGSYTGGGEGTVQINNGQIVITDPGATFNFSGETLQWSGGSLFLSAPFTNEGTMTIAGNVNVAGNSFNNHGVIRGNGSIQIGNLINDGNVTPGTSAGKIMVSGNYTQTSNGMLNIEIGGRTPVTQYDQLEVTGTATLDGVLNVTLIDGFRPNMGDVFQIIPNGSVVGNFASVHCRGFTGQVNYNAGAVTVTVLTVPDIPLNISTRLGVGVDPNQLIGGVIVTGSQPKNVLIRAIGPSLSAFLTGVLADPTLELYQGNTLLESNNNWRDTNQAAIEATGLAPTNDLESAIVRTLAPGAYTAIVRGNAGGTGIGLVEAYDFDHASSSKLANISTRGFVDTGDNVMIGGFIMGGDGGENGRVVIRGIGPSLTQFGVDGAMQDPVLELHDGNGSTLMSNDDWQSSQQAEIEATGLAPTDIHESAIVTTLLGGNYTAIIRGKNNTTGVAVVEVYNIL